MATKCRTVYRAVTGVCAFIAALCANETAKAQDCVPAWSAFIGPIHPGALTRHAMVYDALRGESIIVGGRDTSNTLRGETWVRSGTTWRLAADAAHGPGARRNPCLTYDSFRARVVMFGGLQAGDAYSSTTWEWNGTSWASVGSAPAGRSWHTMAFDEVRGVSVLFGGSLPDNSHPDDTLTWNGTTWTVVATHGPGGREQSAMAYDPLRQCVVLFGGIGPGGYLSDTWEWDGSSWTDVSPTTSGPPARTSHTLVYDPSRGCVVLFGGNNPSDILGDFWGWNGSEWTPLDIPLITPRYYHASAYDTAREKMVVVGGAPTYNLDFLDETLELGCDNTFPIAVCNGPIYVEADGPDGATVPLDGQDSYDPDDDTLSFHWDVSDLSVSLDNPASPTPTGTFPIGITMATLTVADGRGGVDTCDVVVTVQDTTPPQVQCTSDVGMLWPPNGKMRTVKLFIIASDVVGLAAFDTATVTIRSDEPDDAQGNGDGATTGDVNGADGFAAPVNVTNRFAYDPGVGSAGAWVATVQLRAERAGSGDGRCYTVDVSAQDIVGNQVVTSCCIVVPHDQGK